MERLGVHERCAQTAVKGQCGGGGAAGGTCHMT